MDDDWDELIERIDVWDLANQLKLTNTYGFLIECCRLAEDVLPKPALDALAVSELYCAGQATKRELLNAKHACAEVAQWSTEMGDRAGWAARAVFCCLSPTFEPEGAYGCIWWCWDFLGIAGVPDEDILRIGRAHFSADPPVPKTLLTTWKRFVHRLVS